MIFSSTVKTFLRRMLCGSMLLMFIMMLTGCIYSSKYEFVHEDTLKAFNGDLLDVPAEYKVGNTAFITYVSIHEWQDSVPGWHGIWREWEERGLYTVEFWAFQALEENETVVINSVRIEGYKNLDMESVESEPKQTLSFEESTWNRGQTMTVRSSIYSDNTVYENVIDQTQTPISEDSILRVTLNVTVGEGVEAETRELVYDFKAKFRRDLIWIT